MKPTTTPLLVLAALLFSSPTGVAARAMPTRKSWPASHGTVKLSAPHVVKAGTTFDGGMKTYERSNCPCQGQREGGHADTVFLVEAGATLKNVIIGAHQREGVYCVENDCTIDNVWWDDVCEDALTIKGGSAASTTRVLGGGARNAEDKVIQHNGPGTVVVDGFLAQNFGKLYRSCGTCGDIQRHVRVQNVLAINPKVSVVTVNKNFGDVATFQHVKVRSSNKQVEICGWSQGTNGAEPKKLGSGPAKGLCNYDATCVHVV